MTTSQQQPLALAQQLMDEFAARTGLVGQTPPRRYLWTDAFAVCNFLGLHRQLGEPRYLDLAEQLVDQVHHVLGQHRSDDARTGWISGLDPDQAEQSPTRGGLRIGKPNPEPSGAASASSDSQWDADGQYFHYLTKWMHALNRIATVTGKPHYLRWAVELGVAAHQGFTYQGPDGTYQGSDGETRLAWKMSIDLSRPLVHSMGHHDPLDGLITYLQVQQAAAVHGLNHLGGEASGEEAASDEAANESLDPNQLESAIADFTELCHDVHWVTDDALGIGGLLSDAARLGHLILDDGVVSGHGMDLLNLLQNLMHQGEVSLQSFARSSPLNRPRQFRLAFRELGLSIGLRVLERLHPSVQPDPQSAAFAASLLEHRPLAQWIETYWSNPRHRRDENWRAHEDINSVMLATSLEPDGYILSRTPAHRRRGQRPSASASASARETLG